MVKIWCECDQFYLWKSQGMCWQGKMHLGTLEMSLRDFDEELCSGFSRVYEDWWMIRLPDWTKVRIWLWNEGSDWITLCSEFFAVKGRLPATPTSLKSTAFPFGLENFGVNPWSVGSLDNCFGFNWGMDVENGSEGGGKLICKVGLHWKLALCREGKQECHFWSCQHQWYCRSGIGWLFVRL